MEHDTELTVRDARARIDGDTARIEVITDRGRVMLRMHRLVLGALAGAIARALWPKVGDEGPAFPGAEQDVSIQPAAQEPDGESVGTTDGAGLQDVPIQPTAQEPERGDAQAPSEETQQESQEPGEVLAAFEALWPEAEEPAAVAVTGAAPHDVPTQPALEAPDAQLASVARAEPQQDSTAGEPRAPQRKAATRRRKRRS